MERAEELIKRQVQVCKQLLAKEPQSELLLKASQSADSAASCLPRDDDNKEGFEKALQHYTQSVLDSTYHSECQLVEQDFPVSSATERISEIISHLSLPATLSDSPEHIPSLFDVQQLECLHWRVGALLYMYCHTIMGSEERKKEVDVNDFKEYCLLGVCHLKLMLSTRTPLGQDEDYVALDPSVPYLLQRGIFSDIHMLSLMYIGELCYWCWELTKPLTNTADSAQSTVEERKEEEKTQHVQSKEHSQSEKEQEKTRKLSPTKHNEENSTCTRAQSHTGEASSTHTQREEKEKFERLCSLLVHTKGKDFVKSWVANFDAVKEGMEVLSKYIEVARGPLKDAGWSYDRAVKLLVELKRASVKK